LGVAAVAAVALKQWRAVAVLEVEVEVLAVEWWGSVCWAPDGFSRKLHCRWQDARRLRQFQGCRSSP
jgi:hypothetical protein